MGQHYVRHLGDELAGEGGRSSLVRRHYAFDEAATNTLKFDVYRLRSAAGVLPVDDEGNVYLLNEFVPSAGEWQLGIARGGIEKSEQPEQAARRELKEEMGFACEKLVPLWQGYVAPNCTDFQVSVFAGYGLSRIVAEGGDEVYPLDVVRLSLAEALKLVRSGEIKSSVATIALLSLAMMEKA